MPGSNWHLRVHSPACRPLHQRRHMSAWKGSNLHLSVIGRGLCPRASGGPCNERSRAESNCARAGLQSAAIPDGRDQRAPSVRKAGLEPAASRIRSERSASLSYFLKRVGAAGFEPATSRNPSVRTPRLCYAPLASRWEDSNLRPPASKAGALAAALHLGKSRRTRTSALRGRPPGR